MAIINFIGFECGTPEEFSSLNGTVSIQTTNVHSGNYSLLINPTTTGVGYSRNIVSPGLFFSLGSFVATVYHRFYFLYTTKALTGDEEICSSIYSGTSAKISVRLNSAGNLAAYDTTSTLMATGTTVLAASTWYRIEVLSTSGTSTNWEVKINGVSEISGTTNNLSASQEGWFSVGKMVNRNGNSVVYYFDDIQFDTAVYPGNGQILVMRIASNGTYQTFTPNSGTNPHYAYLDELPPDNSTTYLTSPLVIGDAETEGLVSTATAGISGTINAIKTIFYTAQAGASGASFATRIITGGVNNDTGSTNSQPSYAAYGKIYTVDPNTSAAFTTTTLDSTQIGVISEDATNLTNYTAGYVMVSYLPSSTPITGWLSDIVEPYQEKLEVVAY